jgi:chromosome segregation ATPase
MNELQMPNGIRGNVLRRLAVIEARLEAASSLARELLGEADSAGRKQDEPEQKLDAIDSKLEELEKRLRLLESELRDRESPPSSFAPMVEIREGIHYPGLG